MIGTVRSWWSGLSQREQILVSIAGALLSGLVGWFLIFVPLQNAMEDAALAHAAAVNREGAVRNRIDALAATRRANAQATPNAVVAQVAAQAAAEAGLPLARNDPAGNDGAAIAVANGRAAAVLTMLATLAQQRIQSSDLTLRPNGDGSVSLTATLRRAGS